MIKEISRLERIRASPAFKDKLTLASELLKNGHLPESQKDLVHLQVALMNYELSLLDNISLERELNAEEEKLYTLLDNTVSQLTGADAF